MANSRSQDAPATDAAATQVSGAGGRTIADSRSLLRLNSAFQILTSGAWLIAATFTPLYLVSRGASVGVVGAVIACSGFAPLLISIHAGALVDERGSAAVAKGAVSLFALGVAILTILPGVWAVAAAYTLITVGNIGFAVATQAVVAAISTDATRVRNYGYYSFWNSAGEAAGPVVGGFLASHFGYASTFALVGMLMIPSFALAVSLRVVPGVPRHAASLLAAHTLAGAILRRRGVGVILFIAGMMVCAQSLQQSFYPLYLHTVGLSATLIGFVVAAISLSSMLVRMLLAPGMAWFGYPKVLLSAMILVAVAFAITPVLRSFRPLIFVSALMGIGLGFTQPLTMSLLAESVAAEFWGVAFGMRQGVQRLSAVISPLVFGLVSAARGIESAFYLGALMLLGAAGIITQVTGRIRRSPPVAA